MSQTSRPQSRQLLSTPILFGSQTQGSEDNSQSDSQSDSQNNSQYDLRGLTQPDPPRLSRAESELSAGANSEEDSSPPYYTQPNFIRQNTNRIPSEQKNIEWSPIGNETTEFKIPVMGSSNDSSDNDSQEL